MDFIDETYEWDDVEALWDELIELAETLGIPADEDE